MFTESQTRILDILTKSSDREFSMSDLGRALGKHPGVFQRGLNSLEDQGYIISRRESNLRLLRFNTVHPLGEEIATIIQGASAAIPADSYMTYPLQQRAETLRTADRLAFMSHRN